MMASESSGGFVEDEMERRKRLQYLDFTEDDARRLQEIGREVEDLIPEAVDRFYAHLLKFEVRVLIKDDAMLARLKRHQVEYLRDLFRGQYDAAYYESRFRIGEAHVRIGLGPQWYLGMYGIYRAVFVPRILARLGGAPGGATPYILAFDKILLLDGELALDAYIHAYTRDLKELQRQVVERNAELEQQSKHLERLVRERTSELRLSEEKYRGIVDSAVDAIVYLDNDEVIHSWNRGAVAMFGYAPEEMVGRTFHLLLPEGSGDELRWIRSEMRRTGTIRNFETVRIAKDGRRVYVSVTRTLLRNESGEPVGSAAILRDITTMRTFEERMHRAERVAGLGWLASEIAHEVGTPLSVISGRAEHLLSNTSEGDARRRPLEIIVGQIDRISRVLRRALSIVRDPVGEPGEPQAADVADIVSEVLEFFEVRILSRRVSVRRELGQVTVKVNKLELQQVLFNLIQNSLDAMPQGGTLTISVGREGEDALLSVADTGVGIPPENLERIFEPLFTTKEQGRGTGLGLALVARIVRRHHGTIHVESTVGVGTTFRMKLPAQAATQAALA